MSSRYQLYEANTVKLVESLVIKSSDSVDSLNQWVIDYYGVDKVNYNDPHTWKYYLNVSGEYHFTDDSMSVVSWDTLETIEFTKENLAEHRATFKAYEYGSTQYMDLVKKYPNQELLIRGILNPVDIDVAINAENGTVLYYDTDLVEENEYSLIDKINQWVNSYRVRWVNEQFGITDELYPTVHHAIMYLHLVPAILNFRLEACKTNEAHSYHITEYLLSHGIPQYSIMHMTKKQMLFFYRNIKYIQRNAGKVDTFKWILDHIMTERFLPMSEYVMKHSWKDQLDRLLPTVQFRNQPLNDIYGAADQDLLSTSAILTKEDPCAIENKVYREEEGTDIEKTLAYSKSSTVITKMLESAILDYTEAGQNKPEEVLLHHWLYLAVLGKYKAHIIITNPRTDERIPLSAKDAFTLMIYAWAKTMEIDLDVIPQVLAKRVQRIPLPTTAQLLKLVDATYVKVDKAKAMLALSPTIGTIISTEAFNTLGNKIFEAMSTQFKMSALEEHFYTRSLIENMAHGIYCDKLCTLEAPGTTYGQWLTARKLNFDDYTRLEFVDLWSNILTQATGVELEKEPNLMSLQTAMVRLFEYLSSYSIQFIKKINQNGLINLKRPPTRLGDVKGESFSLIEFYDSAIDVLDQEVKTNAKYSIQMSSDGENKMTNVREIISIFDRYHFDLDMDADVNFKPNIVKSYYQYDLSAPFVTHIQVNPL